MIKKYYFLSDLHLKDNQDPKAQNLLRFFISLKGRENQSVVFMVGDIFDLWLGDHKYFIEKYQQLITEMKSFITQGGELHYFEGNHDLHLKKYWQETLGLQVHSDPQHFHCGPLEVRVEHGDQMDPEDKGYIFLRWLLRTPVMRWLIFHLPGFLVARIGQWMSQQSRSYTDSLRNTERILRVIRTHAEKTRGEVSFDIIISGHVHLRDEYQFQALGKKVVSYNLGSWDDEAKVLCYSDNSWQWITLH